MKFVHAAKQGYEKKRDWQKDNGFPDSSFSVPKRSILFVTQGGVLYEKGSIGIRRFYS